MRKALLALAVLAMLVMGAPGAQAHVGQHQFSSGAATPCAAMCAYWDAPTRLGFTPCEYPFPDGSFVDILTEAAPALNAGKTHEVLQVQIDPQVDWDSYICSKGTGVSNGTQKQLAQGTNILGENCDNPLGSNNPAPVGCTERASTPAVPSTQYVIRLYNWLDVAPVPGTYTWVQL
jgi:hypothetical protein